MKNSIKVISLVGACLVSLLGTSCGNRKKDGPLVIWHDKEEGVIDVLSDAISSKLPDVEFEFIRKENLTETLKLVGNDPSSAPDMYIFAHDKIGLFDTIGILEPMENIIDLSLLDNYNDLTISSLSYNDRLLGVPLYYETLLFMYNKEKMKEDEVPETTEELYTYMQENYSGRRYGFVEQHSTAYYSAGWINGFGGVILHDDGTPGLNDRKTIEALKYHKKFIEYMPKGTQDYATVNTLFTEKSADSIFAGPWLVTSAKENNIDLGFAEMPLIPETNKRVSPFCGVQGIQVLKVAVEDPSRKELISDFLEALIDPQVGADLALLSGCAPANNESYDLDEIKNNELVNAIKVSAESATVMPSMPEMDVMWTVLGNLLTEINMNDADVESACNEAQKEAETLIANMK